MCPFMPVDAWTSRGGGRAARQVRMGPRGHTFEGTSNVGSGVLRTIVSGGFRFLRPPTGSRGAPVTKRMNFRSSVGVMLQGSDRGWAGLRLKGVYPPPPPRGQLSVPQTVSVCPAIAPQPICNRQHSYCNCSPTASNRRCSGS